MAKTQLLLTFETEEDKEDFLGWFLDGGGEYQYGECRESNGLTYLTHEMLRDGTPPFSDDEPNLRPIHTLEFKADD